MKNKCFTREEKEEVLRWAEDSSWINQERYEDDDAYLACVEDILENPVFQSMDRFMQHGDTTCKTHCIKEMCIRDRLSIKSEESDTGKRKHRDFQA